MKKSNKKHNKNKFGKLSKINPIYLRLIRKSMKNQIIKRFYKNCARKLKLKTCSKINLKKFTEITA